MKITIIAKKSNFCNQNLIESSKKNGVELDIVDFNNIQDALNFDDWGDVILWRKPSLDKKIDRYLIYEHLKNNNKIVINLGQNEGNICSKYYQQYKVLNYCKKHKYTSLRYIPTYKFSSHEELKKCKALKFPIIEKPDEGSQGKGVRLINNSKEISDFSINIYQNFIPNEGDYRVLCLGSKVLGIIKRMAKEGDVRNNISQGASAVVERDIKIIKKLENLALQISSIFNLNLCGVDLIYDQRNNEYKFIEVNSLVWWEGFSKTTGINIGDKIIKHCIELYNRKNTKIEELIQKYYDENFEHLHEKKFHLASRMYLFLKDKKYKKSLLKLKKEYIGESQQETNSIIKKILTSKSPASIEYRNENDIRIEIFKKYPNLGKYNLILFKFLFSLKVYDKDISSNILKHIELEKLAEYYDEIYSNHLDLCKLSTLAINYLYNIRYFLKHINNKNIPELSPNYLIKNTQHEFKTNLELKNKFNLEIYYYTNLIIGASAFYSEKISKNKKDYIKILKICEKIIQEKYFEINIDNKVEFLVCARLLDYETPLFENIYSECKNSMSDIGNFLIDRNNKCSIMKNKNSFMQSEHRNILFLMAFKNYS